MSGLPILLAMIRTPDLHDAVAQRAQGFDVHWSLEVVGRNKPKEVGRREIASIAALHPVLIVIELEQPVDWLPKVHGDPATRRIPIILITSSAPVAQWASSSGVEVILTPEAFLSAPPDILAEHANIFGASAALEAQCTEAPPALVRKGLQEFNAHEFFECHETLETAWRHEIGPVRELYRVILQVGIAYYQIERGNYWGAHKMFLRTMQWFEPLPDRCQGIDVARLRADAQAAYAHLEALGPDHVADFDRTLIKPVIYEEAPT